MSDAAELRYKIDVEESRRLALTSSSKDGWVAEPKTERTLAAEEHASRIMRRMARMRCVRQCTRIFNIIYTLGLTAVLVYYLYTLVENFNADQRSPSTALNYEPVTVLPYPTITFCQNFDLPDKRSPTHRGCYIHAGGTTTTCEDGSWYYRSYVDPFVPNPLNCLTYNNGSRILNTTSAGVEYSLDLYVELLDQVLVTTYSPGHASIPIADLYRSGVNLGAGLSLLSIAQTNRTALDGSTQMEWNTALSWIPNVDIYNTMPNNTDVTDPTRLVRVRIYYEDMTVQVIKQQITSTLSSLMGSLAGMIGALLGLNAVNVIFGVEGLLMRLLYRTK